MNILQILPALDIGGVETGTVDLARYLTRNGHKAVVVSGGGRLVQELDAIGVRHYTYPVGDKSPLAIMRLIGVVSDIIRKEDIDIVHARSRVPGLIAYFACRRTGRIFITTAHGHYRRGPLSAVMSWGRLVIVASHAMARHMTGVFGVPHERIRLIPRGVDLTRFTRRRTEPDTAKGFVIGMVARITPLKGHADFIRAIALASRTMPYLKAVIVGAAPKEKYLDELKLLVRNLGLSRVVEFAGPSADVAAVVRQFHLLVSATVTPEAFGRSIVEAQAVGVPVVATKVGGVVDIIDDGVTGLLVRPGDPVDMAAKIVTLCRNKEQRAALANAARAKVENAFNLEQMMGRTLAVYAEAMKRTNILVIKMSAVGDVILAVPSLRAIRGRFPDANIEVLIGLAPREVLDHCPYITNRIVCDLAGRHRGFAGLWLLGRRLRQECFDIVIDLQNNRASHFLAFLSMAPARYGYDNGKWSFLLNKRIKDDAPFLDPVDHQFRTLRLAGIKPLDKRLELWPSPASREAADRFLRENWIKEGQDVIGINVRASARWLSKNWPASFVSELADRLAKEYNIRTVLTGTAADLGYIERIMQHTKSKPIVAAGKTDIPELASMIGRFRVYLTPDSAPLHIAAAMGTPVIALFGPTDPARHVPPAGTVVVLRKNAEVKCPSCYNPNCMKHYKCMRRITVDDVLDAMRRFLRKSDESTAA